MHRRRMNFFPTQFNSEVVTVGTTAKLLTGVKAGRPQSPRKTVGFSPAADIWIGGADVTTTNGFKIAAGTPFSVDSVDGLYAITGTGTSAVSLLEGF